MSTIALFYHGFERHANDGPLGSIKSQLRAAARVAYRTARKKQLYTGYYTAFLNLKRSLEAKGHTVRVNDFNYARSHPNEPIGISGYPEVYERVRLPNPAVFGPGFVPAPDKVEAVIQACNLQVVTLPSEWPCKIWRPTLGDRVHPMFVAIDVDAWPDLSKNAKSTDFLIYDKIRWAREERENDVLKPFIAQLEAKGLTYEILRYGHHHLSQFKEALSRSRALAFICEHETQGLAYQEALASNVPVFAWDEGVLVDPYQSKLAPDGLRVSSVPYFDSRCGHVFQKAQLPAQLDAFLAEREGFRPRDYVLEHLNFDAGATRYLSLLEMAKARHVAA